MRIRKISQVAGVVAQVSNIKSTSTTNTYSCDYINNKFNVTVSPETPKETSDLWVKSGPSLKLGEKGYSQTLNGMTLTIDDKYEITFNGTTDKETQFDITSYPISKDEHIMSVKGGNANCLCGIYFYNNSGVYVSGIRSTDGSMVIQELTDDMTSYKATIKIPAGTSLNNYQPKMQIIYGSNNDIEYSSYVDPAIYAKTNERYNLIANKNIYTDGEILIGEFLGKPLYRRVVPIVISNAVENTIQNVRINHNIPNMKFGFVELATKDISTDNFSYGSSGYINAANNRTQWFLDKTQISVSTDRSLDNGTWYVSICYTKTTD